jgi:hypothetical protein
VHPATKLRDLRAALQRCRPATAADDGSPIDLRFEPTEMLRVLARSMLAMNARLARNLCGASGTTFAATLPVVIGFGWLSALTGL